MPQKQTITKAKEQASTFRERMAKRHDERGKADEEAFLFRARPRRKRGVPLAIK